MRYLIDTHIFLWLSAGSGRIAPPILNILDDPDHEVFVSIATAWEIAIKVSLGKLNAPLNVQEWLPAQLQASGLAILPISLAHALAVADLPCHHGDPFDRLLIAQARVEDMTLVTADQWFSQYDVRLLRV
jgi:PIN domain nuclease of toxin-antitoxin system